MNHPKPLRLEYVDGLRALAALSVVLCHAMAYDHYAVALHQHLFVALGRIAVALFIVISGFCLMLPVARREQRGEPLAVVARTFYYRRVRRILPPYYAAMGLTILTIVLVAHEKTNTIWDGSLPLNLQTIVTHALLLHDFFSLPGGRALNYPSWSIPVEFHIYLLMPLFLLALRRWGNLPTLLVATLISLLSHRLLPSRPIIYWYFTLFLYGAVAARCAMAYPDAVSHPRWRWMVVGCLLPTLLLLFVYGAPFYKLRRTYWDLLFGGAVALMLATHYTDAQPKAWLLTHLLSWRPLVQLGEFSYSLYLVHAPLLHLYWLLVMALWRPAPLPLFLLLLGAHLPVIALASLFFRYCEKPFLNTPLPNTRP